MHFNFTLVKVLDLVSSEGVADSSADRPEFAQAGPSVRKSTLKRTTPGKGNKRTTESLLGRDSSGEQEKGQGAAVSLSKAKKKRAKRGYAAPEVYAHLNFVQDCLDYELNSKWVFQV